MLPLPNVALFPHLLLPLHIFEPRYRSMTRDDLDGPGLILLDVVEFAVREGLTGVSSAGKDRWMN